MHNSPPSWAPTPSASSSRQAATGHRRPGGANHAASAGQRRACRSLPCARGRRDRQRRRKRPDSTRCNFMAASISTLVRQLHKIFAGDIKLIQTVHWQVDADGANEPSVAQQLKEIAAARARRSRADRFEDRHSQRRYGRLVRLGFASSTLRFADSKSPDSSSSLPAACVPRISLKRFFD